MQGELGPGTELLWGDMFLLLSLRLLMAAAAGATGLVGRTQAFPSVARIQRSSSPDTSALHRLHNLLQNKLVVLDVLRYEYITIHHQQALNKSCACIRQYYPTVVYAIVFFFFQTTVGFSHFAQPQSARLVATRRHNFSKKCGGRSAGQYQPVGWYGSVALMWRETCGGGGREARESAGSGWCWVPRRTSRALLANLGHDPTHHGARSARAASPCLPLPPRPEMCRPFAHPRCSFAGLRLPPLESLTCNIFPS